MGRWCWTTREWVLAAALLACAAAGCDDGATGLPEEDFTVSLAFVLNPTRPLNQDGRELWAATLDGRLRWLNRDRRARPADPSVSPDGRRVVFSAPASPGEPPDLFIASIDSLQTRPLFSSPEPEEHPLWSPDGARIAFEGIRGGMREIFIVSLTSDNIIRIASASGDLQLGAWSPDARWLAFSAPGEGGRQIEIARSDGGERRRLTGGPGRRTAPAWTPAGDSIAYIADGRARLVGFSGLGDRLLAAVADSLLPPLQWKGDGRALIAAGSGSGRTDIYRIDRENGDAVNLTRLTLPGMDPRMLAGGREFAYVADLTFARKIYLMDTEGFSNRPLTPYYLDESEPAAR